MTQVKKIFLITTLLLLVGGLCSYRLISDRSLPKDLAGNYVSVMPNYVERQLILNSNNIKRGYFTTEGSEKICLNKDFTQSYVNYFYKADKQDSAIYKGTWEVKSDSLVLYFPENKFEKKLSRLRFSNKLYCIYDVTSCRDSSVVFKFVATFKRVK